MDFSLLKTEQIDKIFFYKNQLDYLKVTIQKKGV